MQESDKVSEAYASHFKGKPCGAFPLEALRDYQENHGIADIDVDAAVIDDAMDLYRGQHENNYDFATYVLEHHPLKHDKYSEWVWSFFDYDAYGSHLIQCGDYWRSDKGHYFRNA